MATPDADLSGASSSASSAQSERFAPYIAELQKFFAGRGLPFGTPQDLAVIAQALEQPGALQDEVGSLTRWVFYQEQGAASIADLLEIMTVAMGGAHIADAGDQILEPVRTLVTFIHKALRHGRGPTLVEPTVVRPTSETNEILDPEESQLPLEAETEPWANAPSASQPLQMEPTADRKHTPHLHRLSEPVPSYEQSSALPESSFESYSQREPVSAETGEVQSADHTPHRTPNPYHSPEPYPDNPRPMVVPAAEPGNNGLLRRGSVLAACAVTALAVLGFIFARPQVQTALGFRKTAAVAMTTPPAHPPAEIVQGQQTTLPTALAPTPETQVQPAETPLAPQGANSSAPPQVLPKQEPTPRQRSATMLAPHRDTPAAHRPGIEAPSKVARSQRPDHPERPGRAGAQGTPRNGRSTPAAPTAAVNPAEAKNGERHDASNRLPPPPGKPLPARRGGAYTVSSGVMAGNLIDAPAPEYPRLAGALHLEGQVILQAVVSRNGQVVATHVLRGHHLLRGAAENAVRRWRYKPFVLNGQSTDVATIITVNFERH